MSCGLWINVIFLFLHFLLQLVEQDIELGDANDNFTNCASTCTDKSARNCTLHSFDIACKWIRLLFFFISSSYFLLLYSDLFAKNSRDYKVKIETSWQAVLMALVFLIWSKIIELSCRQHSKFSWNVENAGQTIREMKKSATLLGPLIVKVVKKEEGIVKKQRKLFRVRAR